ncbi:uncharacterized protein LOC121422688 [Lytechinus variegatus]|uniref:uncharacterized protein LOC121422688 n=1 Tax=Lytechinus variegatus TaxID=7654 RepID=UPI001BB23DF5|nr:uncharacterized protein LOC121422688 [Lytechinus variegatus]XP_041473797.1 uncharacterized protein LOC121422688 [Lytechinus variegatus]XP_041473804.1 uncharacterized protein LOC121422688 [Lytechinus variegatus]XP_041473812.1 uncharacterized protein LOC121422688 [Lytechinus variegatus]
MRRKYGRTSCFSDEWLIWCGLNKRSDTSSELAINPRSANGSRVYYKNREEEQRNVHSGTSVKLLPHGADEGGNNESAIKLLPDNQHLQTSEWVQREFVEQIRAIPSEKSPNRPGTPDTVVTSLLTDEEDISPKTTAVVHQSGTHDKIFKFHPRGSLHGEGQHGNNETEQARSIQINIGRTLNNIPENGSVDDGKDLEDHGITGEGLDKDKHSSGSSNSDDEVFELERDGSCRSTCFAKLGSNNNSQFRDRFKEGAYSSTKSPFDQSSGNGRQVSYGRADEFASDSQVVEAQIKRNKQPQFKGEKHPDKEVESEGERLIPMKSNQPSGSLGPSKLQASGEYQESPEVKRRAPRSAPPDRASPPDTTGSIHANHVHLTVQGDVKFDFNNHVSDVHVGDRTINNNDYTKIFPQNTNVTGEFNRSSTGRHTR